MSYVVTDGEIIKACVMIDVLGQAAFSVQGAGSVLADRGAYYG